MLANYVTGTLVGLSLICFRAFPETNITPEAQRASELLTMLLSRDTPEVQWSAAEKEFEALPPKIAIPILFPEVAKGIPFGQSYAPYNCYEPLHDRRVPGWGEFCVVNWLWCKQLACIQRRAEVSAALLELWAHPISYAGQTALLGGLCGSSNAESRITALFRDTTADVRLRTEAAQCLLFQDEAKYHTAVVQFAETAPIRFSPPGRMPYPNQLRRILFDALARHRHSGVDAAVVRIGFGLLADQTEQRQKTSESGANVSYYGEFIYANSLNTYLGTAFVPYRKPSIYPVPEGNEQFWHDTVVNALAWWSKHQREYAQ